MPLHMRIANIQDTDIIKCEQGCGATGILTHCWWESKILLLKTVLQFLAILNILLPYHPAIEFLGIYPNEFKIYIKQNLVHDSYSNFIHNC